VGHWRDTHSGRMSRMSTRLGQLGSPGSENETAETVKLDSCRKKVGGSYPLGQRLPASWVRAHEPAFVLRRDPLCKACLRKNPPQITRTVRRGPPYRGQVGRRPGHSGEHGRALQSLLQPPHCPHFQGVQTKQLSLAEGCGEKSYRLAE